MARRDLGPTDSQDLDFSASHVFCLTASDALAWLFHDKAGSAGLGWLGWLGWVGVPFRLVWLKIEGAGLDGTRAIYFSKRTESYGKEVDTRGTHSKPVRVGTRWCFWILRSPGRGLRIRVCGTSRPTPSHPCGLLAEIVSQERPNPWRLYVSGWNGFSMFTKCHVQSDRKARCQISGKVLQGPMWFVSSPVRWAYRPPCQSCCWYNLWSKVALNPFGFRHQWRSTLQCRHLKGHHVKPRDALILIGSH